MSDEIKGSETKFYFTLAINGSMHVVVHPGQRGMKVAVDTMRHSIMGSFNADPLPGVAQETELRERFNTELTRVIRQFVADRMANMPDDNITVTGSGGGSLPPPPGHLLS